MFETLSQKACRWQLRSGCFSSYCSGPSDGISAGERSSSDGVKRPDKACGRGIRSITNARLHWFLSDECIGSLRQSFVTYIRRSLLYHYERSLSCHAWLCIYMYSDTIFCSIFKQPCLCVRINACYCLDYAYIFFILLIRIMPISSWFGVSLISFAGTPNLRDMAFGIRRITFYMSIPLG